jgi:Membrane proteins related to metalloendopeptidases
MDENNDKDYYEIKGAQATTDSWEEMDRQQEETNRFHNATKEQLEDYNRIVAEEKNYQNSEQAIRDHNNALMEQKRREDYANSPEGMKARNLNIGAEKEKNAHALGADGLRDRNRAIAAGKQVPNLPLPGLNQKNHENLNSNIDLKKAAGALINPKKAAFDMAKEQALGGKDKSKDKTDAEKSLKEKEADQEATNKANGNFSVELKKSTLIKLMLICCVSCFTMVFFVALLATLADNRAAALVIGTLVGDDKNLVKNTIDLLGQGPGENDDLAVGMGNKRSLENYYKRLEVLGNVFSSEVFNCTTVEECTARPEFKYYLKVADIATRYKAKYGVNLDWVLLNATIFYSDSTEEKTMSRALNDYSDDDVENYDILMNLDWDYDYKKIPGYRYLDPKVFIYDLQILAKNMVKKTTVQTCTKTTTDAEGNTITVITKSQTDLDVEEQYLKPGQPYYLKCDAGETYAISSNYAKDDEKYNEFLLEYIEHKFYLPGTTGVNEDGSTDMTPSPATGEYIFPLPSGATRCRSSAYGYRIHPITGKPNNHSGDDYPAASGTPVYAVADGTVVAAGFEETMGYYVKIDHSGGVQSVYMHASKLHVSSGDTVKQGDVIMAVGTTGSSTGNHLHITFKLNGTTVNPAGYIGALSMCG